MSNLEPKHMLFNSLEEMLATETISGLLKRSISQVTCQPFDSSNGFSGNQLFHVEADGIKLVIKRLRPSVDWLAIVSNDHQCRSIRVWQYGLLDRIQPHLQHGILAACQEGDDYAILMRDVSPGLIQWGQELTPQMIQPMLEALAAMHAMYWEEDNLKAAELGLISVETMVSFFKSAQPEHYQHAPEILNIIRRGRSALYELLEPDASDALQTLVENPEPLKSALVKFPSTFVHTDFRLDNLAFLPDTKELVVFDWQIAGFAPSTMDLCWFVMCGGIFHQQEAYYQYYCQRLSEYLGDRFNPGLWQPMLEMGCLVDVLRKGGWHAYFATTSEDESFREDMRQSVNSYNDIIRKGLVWL